MNAVVQLIKVELTRMWWRRAVRVLVALAVLLPLAVFGLRVHDTSPRDYDELVADYGTFVEQEVTACERRGTDRDTCEKRFAARFSNELTLDGERSEGGGLASMVFLVMLMLLLGTTFAGHDWNTGSMSNQLLFEPRRERVWLAKGLAVGLLTGTVALAVMVLYWTGIYAVISARDLGIRDHALAAAYKQAVLAGIIAAVAGTFGYALTMLLRSTVGTLGLLFAVAFLCIVVVAGVLGVEGNTERFMPWGNFYAYAVGSYDYYTYDGLCEFDGGSSCDGSETISRSASLVYFAILWLVVAAPSLFSFRERDLP